MEMLGENALEISSKSYNEDVCLFLYKICNIKSTDFLKDNQCFLINSAKIFLIINDNFHYEIKLCIVNLKVNIKNRKLLLSPLEYKYKDSFQKEIFFMLNKCFRLIFFSSFPSLRFI